jgi:hypothetical protein
VQRSLPLSRITTIALVGTLATGGTVVAVG